MSIALKLSERQPDVWRVRALRDWAEEHWEAVGVAVSIAGALMLAIVLVIAFNVIATGVARAGS